MFDNLRDSEASYFQEDQPNDELEQNVMPAYSGFERAPAEKELGFSFNAGKSKGKFLGMTAVQRFILTLLFFLMVCVLGSMFLLLTGSIVLPF